MPHLFGATMVPDRAHYKHVREVQRRMSEREDKLGSWAKEKAERQKRLAQLQHQVREKISGPAGPGLGPPRPPTLTRPRSASACSTASTELPPYSSTENVAEVTPVHAQRESISSWPSSPMDPSDCDAILNPADGHGSSAKKRGSALRKLCTCFF